MKVHIYTFQKIMDYKCAMTINRLIHQAMAAWATLTVQTSFWKSEGWFETSNAHACGCSGAVAAVVAMVGVVAMVAMVALGVAVAVVTLCDRWINVNAITQSCIQPMYISWI